MDQPDPAARLERENTNLRQRLDELESRLAASLQTLAALPSALIQVDQHGRIAAVNPAGAALLGLPPGERAGLPLRELSLPSDVIELLAQLAEEVFAAGKPAPRELFGPDGQHYEIAAFAQRDAAGALVGAVLEARGIGERKRLEEDLWLIEARFRVAATLSADSIYEVDLSTNKVRIYSGDSYREQGLQVEALDLGLWEAALHPDDRARILAARERLIEQGTPFDEEYRFLLPNNEVIHLADRSVLLERPGAPRRYQIGVTTDITERRRLEEALRFQAQVLDVVGQAVIVTDLGGSIIYINHAAEQIYGWSRAEIVGRSIVSMVSPVHRPQGEVILAALPQRREMQSGELLMQRRDGTIFPAAITVTPVVDGAGQLVALAGASSDMSERERREAERLELERRLQEGQRLESLVAMAGGVAHDYNNILMAILGHAELAIDDVPAGSVLHDGISAIITEARRAAALANQMLAYSGRGHVLTQPINLAELLQGMQAQLHATLRPGMQLVHSQVAPLPLVEGNAVQLRQVVLSLVTNAVEAMGAGEGVVTVVTAEEELSRQQLDGLIFGAERQPGRYLRLTVADTGHGMDGATLGRIFDPFFSTRFAGRGLGLAVVHGVVRGHRGAMQVWSQPGQGTTFSLWLPAATARSVAPEPIDRARLAPSPPAGTVLIIDDEPAVRAVLRRMLERLGLQVREAVDGPSGLMLLEELGDDLRAVLVDVTMPAMSGGAVAEQVTARRPGTPVVLMSGYPAEEVMRQHAHLPLAGVLQKPFSSADVRRLLGESGPPSS